MKRRISCEITFWLVYYLGISFISASYDQRFIPAFMSEAIQLPLKVAATYLVLHYLVPKYLLTEKHQHFLVGLTALVIGSVLIQRLTFGLFLIPLFYPDLAYTPYDPGRAIWALFDVFFPVCFAACIRLVTIKYEGQRREQSLENENNMIELNYLKAEVQPKFLYNTLTNIHGLALANAPETSAAILKLSGLFDFILQNGSRTSIPLRDEIKVLNEYVELERLRYGERLQFLFAQKVDDLDVRIAPLLLLPFVENSFKHDREDCLNSFVHISLVVTGGLLSFRVTNNREKGTDCREAGLANIKRQLDLMYKKSYNLESYSSEKEYAIELNINLRRHGSYPFCPLKSA